MKPILIAVTVFLGLWWTPAALGQSLSAHQPYTAKFQHVQEPDRPAYQHGQFTHMVESNCHPSRAALLVRTVQASKYSPTDSRLMRAEINALRNRMSKAERREAAKLFRIQANYRTYHERQAREEARIAARNRRLEEVEAEVASETSASQIATTR